MELKTHKNNRQKCNLCHRYIPSYISRLNIVAGRDEGRLCNRCILQVARLITKKDKKLIKVWEKEIMVDEL